MNATRENRGSPKESEFVWRVGERAAAFASEDIFRRAEADGALKQLLNVSALPGLVSRALVMPDVHLGYGFPIGGVAAFDAEEGVVSPGGVGYDINCGVRTLLLPVTCADAGEERIRRLLTEIYETVPCGLGVGGKLHLVGGRMRRVLETGAAAAVEMGFGEGDDLARLEEGGLAEADAGVVPKRALERGARQLGTLGSGNHFVEVDRVAEVLDDCLAAALGLTLDTLTVTLHTGSRGLGHQVADEYIREMRRSARALPLPDPQLSCAMIDSDEGRRYVLAMGAAANFAWANRQVISSFVSDAVARVFGERPRTLYDIAHNIARFETHGGRRVLVHRKGATRAFPPGSESLGVYAETGQPVLVPGDMGRCSYVAVGGPRSLDLSFGSACHGAGRALSRKAASRRERGEAVRDRLAASGIRTLARSLRTLSEEAPEAYKDVEEVVGVSAALGLVVPVAKLVPLGVVKG